MGEDLQQRYEVLKKSLAGVGYVRRGSVVRRFMPCGKSGCVCQESPPQLHGPYYQWTRKIRGKTVTVRLTPEQADHLRRWIESGRELNRIVAQMERLSLRATDRLLRGLTAASRAPRPRGLARKKPAR